MEYMEPDFPGLYEAVRGRTDGEFVSINVSGTTRKYGVQDVARIHDGRTFKAILIPVTAE